MRFDFIVPGDLSLATGGYAYDRQVIDRAGAGIRHVQVSARFPNPDPDDIAEVARVLASARAPVLIDGLACGALPRETIADAPVPVVALCHHPLGLETGLPTERALELFQQEADALSACAHVIVTSNTTARSLESHLGVSPDDITVAEPGLDRRSPAPRTGTPPCLLTVASLTPRKGHDVLIAALERVADRNWTAVWVGANTLDPTWAGMLDARIAESPIGHRITRHGTLSGGDLSALYGTADIFCLPSHYEGYGMVFAEAMMAGLPIVACAGGAVPEVVPVAAGLLMEPGDPIALGNALDLVLRDRDLADRMAAAGHAHAQTLPDWDDTTATVRAVLRGVAR